jgi:hypothetical protein
MPQLIKCSVESIRYLRGETVCNLPVNIDLCKSIRKSKFSWYPDNKGKPSIQFLGCDQEWVFDRDKDRDSEFERILELQNVS